LANCAACKESRVGANLLLKLGLILRVHVRNGANCRPVQEHKALLDGRPEFGQALAVSLAAFCRNQQFNRSLDFFTLQVAAGDVEGMKDVGRVTMLVIPNASRSFQALVGKLIVVSAKHAAGGGKGGGGVILEWS